MFRARHRSGARDAARAQDQAYEAVRRRGVLLSFGVFVGESFVGVLIAADTVAGRSAALAVVGPDFARLATGLGLAVFLAARAVFTRLVARAPVESGPDGGRRPTAPAFHLDESGRPPL